jgi:glyoxylase-like metal-dependent hydrolase (beta-lactamase superfamily II)
MADSLWPMDGPSQPATGKKLTTIYVSQSDPDYYFGLGPVKAAWPKARVIAASATVAAIKGNVQKKLDTWGPKLKENGPQSLGDIVMPEEDNLKSLSVDGQAVEIVDAVGLLNRRYVWVPSLEAVVGGVLVFGGLHVWTADTPTAAERAAWIKTLDAMSARKPKIVVPGHMATGSATDAWAISHTRDYLIAFEQELVRAANSAELILAMKKRYPQAGLGIALEIGAKVAKSEMKWG